MRRQNRLLLVVLLLTVAMAVFWEHRARYRARAAFSRIQRAKQSQRLSPDAVHSLVRKSPDIAASTTAAPLAEEYWWSGLLGRQRLMVLYFTPGANVTKLEDRSDRQPELFVFDVSLNDSR
jgi:hypothetical protein